MEVIIGSARINERGGISGGAAGDQKQSNTPDYTGEVSLEKFYNHKLGWLVFRAKQPEVARKIALTMYKICNNPNIGYDQGTYRLGVVKYGSDAQIKTGADCGSAVRQCVREAAGIDPGNFNTSTEPKALMNTGLFNQVPFTSKEALREGDILVTKTKGHTAVVVNAIVASNGVNISEATNAYYRVYTSKWLAEVENLKDYAGIEDKAISGVMVRVPDKTVETRVGLKGGHYLDWVTGYDPEDKENGYAGVIGKPIDRLQIKMSGITVMYRVSLVGNKGYLPWVANTADYAGIKGKAIDKVQVYVK